MRALLISATIMGTLTAVAMPLRIETSGSSAREENTRSTDYCSAAAAAADDDLSFDSPPTSTQIETTCPTSRNLLRSLSRFLQLLPDSDLNQITRLILDNGVIRYLDLARLHAHFALRIQGIQVHPRHRASLIAAIQDVALAFQDAYQELDTDDAELFSERMENSRIEHETLSALKRADQEDNRSRTGLIAPIPTRAMLPGLLNGLSNS